MRRGASGIFLLARLRGRIEEGEATVLQETDIVIATAASPTLPSPAGGGGSLRRIA